MRHGTKAVLAAAVVMLLAGCREWTLVPRKEEPSLAAEPARKGQADYLDKAAVAGDTETPGPSAVESALAWSEKYSRAAEQLVAAEQAKRELEAANRKLLAQVARLQTDLDEAKKELSDANAMIITFRKELDNWKASVLGYRSEIREAQQAQLDHLKKILVLLGGDIPKPAVPAPATTPPAKEVTVTQEEPARDAG